MKIKKTEEYNIPMEYKTIISDFYNKVLRIMDNKLLLFVVTR